MLQTNTTFILKHTYYHKYARKTQFKAVGNASHDMMIRQKSKVIDTGRRVPGKLNLKVWQVAAQEQVDKVNVRDDEDVDTRRNRPGKLILNARREVAHASVSVKEGAGDGGDCNMKMMNAVDQERRNVSEYEMETVSDRMRGNKMRNLPGKLDMDAYQNVIEVIAKARARINAAARKYAAESIYPVGKVDVKGYMEADDNVNTRTGKEEHAGNGKVDVKVVLENILKKKLEMIRSADQGPTNTVPVTDTVYETDVADKNSNDGIRQKLEGVLRRKLETMTPMSQGVANQYMSGTDRVREGELFQQVNKSFTARSNLNGETCTRPDASDRNESFGYEKTTTTPHTENTDTVVEQPDIAAHMNKPYQKVSTALCQFVNTAMSVKADQEAKTGVFTALTTLLKTQPR